VRARQFSCPPASELMAQARRATGDAPHDAALRAEIADRSSEAVRALSMAAFVPRGAARISLAAGTAFAVLALAIVTRESPMTAVIGALVAFTGGSLGAVTAANIGQRARNWASEQRTLWVRAAREAEREIERR
jgi:hypothetical protein